MNRQINNMLDLFRRMKAKKIAIKSGRVFFHNIWGKYNDNNKAIAEI